MYARMHVCMINTHDEIFVLHKYDTLFFMLLSYHFSQMYVHNTYTDTHTHTQFKRKNIESKRHSLVFLIDRNINKMYVIVYSEVHLRYFDIHEAYLFVVHINETSHRTLRKVGDP